MNTKFKCSWGSPSTATTPIVFVASFDMITIGGVGVATVSLIFIVLMMADTLSDTLLLVSRPSSFVAVVYLSEVISTSYLGYFNNNLGLPINFMAGS